MASHAAFCLTAIANTPDDPSCPDLLNAANDTPQVDDRLAQKQEAAAEPATPQQASGEAQDCSQFKRASERIKCERRDIRPQCSDSVVALEGEARLLATQVELNLASYGDLLTRDLTDVSSRSKLCAFSLDELDNQYAKATDDPAQLRIIQQTATDFQTCAGDWEEYVRRGAENSQVSDALSDDVARQLEVQFRPLKDQIANLSDSITTLNRAAGQIEQLIGIHVDFCDPVGTPLPAE